MVNIRFRVLVFSASAGSRDRAVLGIRFRVPVTTSCFLPVFELARCLASDLGVRNLFFFWTFASDFLYWVCPILFNSGPGTWTLDLRGGSVCSVPLSSSDSESSLSCRLLDGRTRAGPLYPLLLEATHGVSEPRNARGLDFGRFTV